MPFVFYCYQMQTLEFIGSRKIRVERTGDERMRKLYLSGRIRPEIMSSEDNLGLRKEAFLSHLCADKKGLDLKSRPSGVDFPQAFCQVNGFYGISNLSRSIFLKCMLL